MAQAIDNPIRTRAGRLVWLVSGRDGTPAKGGARCGVGVLGQH